MCKRNLKVFHEKLYETCFVSCLVLSEKKMKPLTLLMITRRDILVSKMSRKSSDSLNL